MKREIKFRAWDEKFMVYHWSDQFASLGKFFKALETELIGCNYTIVQYTGLKDKNGKEIYFGDRLRFSDKWEWYRGQYGIKMMAAEGKELENLKRHYEAEPYEERIIEGIEDYEWLLSGEIQQYWEVIGNKHEDIHNKKGAYV